MRSSLLLSSLLFLVACGGTTSTVVEPTRSYEGPVTSTDVEGGQAVWSTHCAGCHSERDGAYGPRVTGHEESAAEMREQVREGGGRMPGFAASQISDDDLEKLLAYLQTIHAVAAN